MTEENRIPEPYSEPPAGPPLTPAPDFAGQAAMHIAEGGSQLASVVGRFTEMARADAAVGPAQSAGGHTLVPLASVTAQAGFGLGFGGGGGSDDKRNSGGGSGGGAGGGGRSSARVIAVADVSDDGVQIRPVVDVTALALGAMVLIGLRILSGRGSRRLLGMLPAR